MIVVEYKKIELDYCNNCHGVWFDTGELELLVQSSALTDVRPLLDSFLNAGEAKTAEKKRRCPICATKMRKVNIGTASGGALIDACVRGHGLWFDGGEVDLLFKYLAGQHPETEHHQVFHFMNEVFQSK